MMSKTQLRSTSVLSATTRKLAILIPLCLANTVCAADTDRHNILFIIADDPQHSNKVKEMELLLLTEMRRHDDPYRFTGQPNDAPKPQVISEQPKREKKPRKNKRRQPSD